MDVFNIIIKTRIAHLNKHPSMEAYRIPLSFNIARNLFTRSLVWTLILLLPCLTVTDAHGATEAKVLFIKSGSAYVYNSIVDAAEQRVNQICQSNNEKCTNLSITIKSTSDIRKLDSINLDSKWDLIVTVGTNAAMQLNAHQTNSPVLYTLIPSHSYPTIRKSSSSKNISAIYIDQPIRRQLQLIKSALPSKDKVGVLLGSYSGVGKNKLQKIIQDMGLKPTIINTTSNNLGSNLEEIYSKVDVLLAQPDPSVYNKKTVMTVLLSSYRHNIPVFGYSAAFVRSGATAAIYSSPKDIGWQIGEEIINFLASNNRKLSTPAYPKYFSVDTNKRVIRSLNISMQQPSAIKNMIMKAR